MTCQELFIALQAPISDSQKSELITQVISDGGDIEEIREMLDYLEVCELGLQ